MGDGSYDAGETLEVTLVWSEPVTVETPHDGLPPKMWVSYADKYDGVAVYVSGSGTARTVFTHVVRRQNGDSSFSFMGVVRNTLRERDGSIRSVQSGLRAETTHGAYHSTPAGAQAEASVPAATIVGQPTFNDPGSDGLWGYGETVEVTFNFSHPVQVDTAAGTPQLEIQLGGTAARQAAYLRGSGSQQLVFGYTLVVGDGTHSSLLVAPNSLDLNGGSIRNVGTTVDAVIDHQGGRRGLPPRGGRRGPGPPVGGGGRRRS